MGDIDSAGKCDPVLWTVLICVAYLGVVYPSDLDLVPSLQLL